MSEWDAISAPAEATDWDAFSEVHHVEVVGKRRKKKRGWMDDVTGAMANVNRGLGVGDELAAAGGVVTGLFTGRHKLTDPVVPAFKAELAAQRGREDEFAEERPRVAAVARGAGNALTMAAPIGPGAQAFATGGKAINALRGATVAGLTGAGYAAVDRGTPQERLTAASKAAADPLTLGLGAAGGALAAPRARPRDAAPSLEELQTQRTAAYDDVAASGHVYAPEEIQGLAQSVVDDLASVQINPARHPRAASMMEDISGLAAEGEPLTLTQLDQLRQVVRRDVANSRDDAEAYMGRRIIDRIDSFIEEAGGEGSETVLRARDLNTRVRKIESLDTLDAAAADRAAASGTGANVDNTARQNVIRFQRDTRNLTPAEGEAAQRVIRGTPGQNALRMVGRLSPEGGTVPAVASIFTGTASGGAIPAAGFIARRVADAMTRRNVDELRALIAQGGEAAEKVSRALADPAYAELRQQLANDLSVQAGVQGASASVAR